MLSKSYSQHDSLSSLAEKEVLMPTVLRSCCHYRSKCFLRALSDQCHQGFEVILRLCQCICLWQPIQDKEDSKFWLDSLMDNNRENALCWMLKIQFLSPAPKNACAHVAVECSEKHKSFKLKIPQPDSKRRHSPDFRTVFGIMIGPFSSCEIGKT